ncbi:MAG: aldehyde dehydrogenase [Chitinophagales bacterium]|nr:aldehyde dehydrogenase [Chitinophagales bacterium]
MQIPKYLQNYINGKLQKPIDNQYIDNVNPAIGEVYSQIPLSNHKDLEKAVQSAKEAFPFWSNAGIKYRSEILIKLAQLIKENEDFLAQAESLDNGKPIKLAKAVDIPRAYDNIHFFATAIEHFASEAHHMENTAINYTLRRPIGVVGCISPWNLPLYLFTWKIAPALASGNCVIAKPSEVTPLTAYLFSELCIKAGLPKGVLNILHGTGQSIGQEIVAHPEIKAISFTGGTATGAHIAKTAAPMFKKLSLELGGKNPNIIFNDANIEEAVDTSVKAAFSNQGQICLCGSRIYVQADIYDEFKEKFVAKVKQLKVGNPADENTNIGAVVSKPHFDKILKHIAIAKEEDGKILTGGKPITIEGAFKNGFYIEPTVIENLPLACSTNKDEIFGPVVTLNKFETEEEVIALANDNRYGLSATIFTEDLRKAHRVAEKIEAGIVWVNTWLLRDLRTPFGGVKSSGVGREGGFEALRFFTEPKNICIKY